MAYTNKQIEEEILVKRIKAGDSNAFESLERYYHPFLMQYYKKIKKIINTIDIDELFQLGRIGLYNAVKGYDKDNDTLFHTYAVLIITGYLNNYYRKNRKHFFGTNYNVVSLDYSFDQHQLRLMDMIGDRDDDSVAVRVNTRILLEEVYRSLNSEREKDVLIYRIQGYSYQEIADKMNLTFKDVDNTIQKIRRKLRKISSEER